MADKDILEQDDVLEFEDDSLPELPDDNPFEEAASKKPWLLAGIGLVAITLVIVVVLKLTTGGKDDMGLIEIPIEQGAASDASAGDDFVDGANRLVSDSEKPVGMPERVVEHRGDVVFDPDKPAVQRPKPRPIKQDAQSSKPRAASNQPAAKGGAWYVQVGSYNTRAAAESGQRKMVAAHKGLFAGHNLVILSAVLPNGQTAWRLRVAGFATSDAAGGFCRNAKQGGISCYVTK